MVTAALDVVYGKSAGSATQVNEKLSPAAWATPCRVYERTNSEAVFCGSGLAVHWSSTWPRSLLTAYSAGFTVRTEKSLIAAVLVSGSGRESVVDTPAGSCTFQISLTSASPLVLRVIDSLKAAITGAWARAGGAARAAHRLRRSRPEPEVVSKRRRMRNPEGEVYARGRPAPSGPEGC